MPTKREIGVKDIRIRHLTELLPDTVFPVKVGVELSRTDRYDEPHPELRDCCLEVMNPGESPFIPSQTIYFYNPVEFPDSGDDPIDRFDFEADLKRVVDTIRSEDPTADERLYLKKLQLVEVPSKYLIYDNGRVVDCHDDLWSGSPNSDGLAGERVGIATFDKRSKVQLKEVREQYGTSLPGNVQKPMKLTSLKEVTLKPGHGSSQTIGGTSKRRYWTEGKIKQHPKARLSWAPKEWSEPDDHIIWKQIEDLFPKLASSDFLSHKELEGDNETEEVFVEHEVREIKHERAPLPDGGDGR